MPLVGSLKKMGEKYLQGLLDLIAKLEKDRDDANNKWMVTDKVLTRELARIDYLNEIINHLMNELDILRTRHMKRCDSLELELSVTTAKSDVRAKALLIASGLLYTKYGFTVDHPRGIYHWLICQAEEEIHKNNEL
jgi:hypothetical protein